ncbi:MAG: hypothetical protein R3E95_19210 [Thiolinea sp.]
MLWLPEWISTLGGEAAQQALQQQWAQTVTLTVRLALGVFLFAVLLLMFWPGVDTLRALAGAAVLHILLLVMIVFPTLGQVPGQSLREAARYARHYLGNQTLVMDGAQLHGFTLYRGDLTLQRAPAVDEYVLTQADYPQQHPQQAFMTAFRHGNVVILQRLR